MSWFGVKAYCEWISEKIGKNYYLPTEAEWEYAARGGLKSKNYTWAGLNDKEVLFQYANFCDSACSNQWRLQTQNDNYTKTAPVGSFLPNELGIFDMSGNVWEWCNDWYDENYYIKSPRSNPEGADNGKNRVVRGGAWMNSFIHCRTTYRESSKPDTRNQVIGFRVVEY